MIGNCDVRRERLRDCTVERTYKFDYCDLAMHIVVCEKVETIIEYWQK